MIPFSRVAKEIHTNTHTLLLNPLLQVIQGYVALNPEQTSLYMLGNHNYCRNAGGALVSRKQSSPPHATYHTRHLTPHTWYVSWGALVSRKESTNTHNTAALGIEKNSGNQKTAVLRVTLNLDI